jgi:uncharacterized RDD family membrane protein YckC
MTASSAPDPVAYASWGRRALAVFIDTALVVCGVVALYVLAWVAGGYDYDTDTLADAWVAVYVPLIVLGPPLYFWLMVGRYGSTVGKLAVGVVVRRSDDLSAVGYPRALARVGSWVLLSWLVLPLVLSILWPFWDARNQTLVDKMVSTVVLRRQVVAATRARRARP